jgi:hypothetical protein
VLNTEENKANIIVTLITDIALLIMVLVGLLRLHGGGGSFALGRLLWKQVGWGDSSSPWCSRFTDLLSFLKGVIWLLIATVAEVPPTVSTATFLVSRFANCHLNVAGIHHFESERYCCFRSSISVKGSWIEHDFFLYQVRSTS